MACIRDVAMNAFSIRCPERREEVHREELDGEAILYDAAFGTMCRLNDTSYFVYRLCDGSMTVEEIARRVTDRYDVAIETARRDVERTVAELADGGFLVTGEGVAA